MTRGNVRNQRDSGWLLAYYLENVINKRSLAKHNGMQARNDRPSAYVCVSEIVTGRRLKAGASIFSGSSTGWQMAAMQILTKYKAA